MGDSEANTLLDHAEGGSLKYYSKNTGNFNMVGTLLDQLHTKHTEDEKVCFSLPFLCGDLMLSPKRMPWTNTH